MSTCVRPHVVVTGASSGIGRATAIVLANAGQHVYAGVRKPADGAALELAATQAGTSGEVTSLTLDVVVPDQIAAAVSSVADHTGSAGLSCLVNNAGIGGFAPLELIGIDTFRRLLEVNVTGQLAVTQAFLPLLRQARGRIVMIGSIGTRFTPPFVGPLAASKSALSAMTEALRQELAPWNIRVTLIEPGSIKTEAVEKLDDDAQRVMKDATPAERDLYQDAFGRMTVAFGALHERGSSPDVVARAVLQALTHARPRPRYLSGKNSHRMAAMAAILPVAAQDALRRRLMHQPAPGSRIS